MPVFSLTLAIGWILVLSLAVWPVSAFSEVQVLEIALSRSIENREPLNLYSPTAFCEKNRKKFEKIPVIDSALDHTVVFWNRLASTSPAVVHHLWHKKVESRWEVMATVEMEIAKSRGFRIWSTKDLMASLHRGEWMVVVSLAEDPQKVLCIARFLVQ